jgi:methylphosphotriester-DNA--protein-cysteine methyltransferase
VLIFFFDGNLRAFARFFGTHKSSVDAFYKTQDRYTSLELLLRIAFKAGVTLLNLLTKEHALSDFNPLLATTGANKRLTPRRKKENVRKILLTAAKEKPPPSLNELARRLEYSSADTLRQYFPQICNQLTANYLEFRQGKRERDFSSRRLQSDEVIKVALEAALQEDPPPSVNQVAKSLGYTSGQAINTHFPELCKALADRQRNLITTRRARIKGALKQAIDSDPPVSLDEVIKSLGYKNVATVRLLYSAESRRIRHRYKEHVRKQFLSKIETALRLVLDEMPPPQLKVALRRIGVADGTLRKYFPKEHRVIAKRYLEFRHGESMMKKENARKKIKAIVVDLLKRGIFPSMTLVLELFPANCLKRPEVWATIRQAREEFSSAIRTN